MSRVMDRLGFIEPQLPTLTDEAPQGEAWIHEIEHDGYRTLLCAVLSQLGNSIHEITRCGISRLSEDVIGVMNSLQSSLSWA